MKYIRTKDGRILLGTWNDNDLTGMVLDYQDGKIVKIPIVAQADNIEELCDEFVVEDRDEFAIFHNLKLAKQTKGIVYGAIWTEWGLKYVAKMNEKGCLELL